MQARAIDRDGDQFARLIACIAQGFSKIFTNAPRFDGGLL
jgi:hypothetical protein